MSGLYQKSILEIFCMSFLTKRSGVMPEADAPFGAFRNLHPLPEEIPAFAGMTIDKNY